MIEKMDGRKNILIVGVAGGTGSGKSTIARSLLARLKQASVVAETMTMDSYYRDLHHLPLEERAKTNFDHPASLEIDLLIEHVKQLRNGNAIEAPVYDFEKHQRKKEVSHVEPPQILIIEGILLFVEPKLRELIDIKVFVDASADIRFIRRLKRDVAERGRTMEQICEQYLDTVKKMHDEFVEPSKHFADVLIPNMFEGDFDVIVDLLAAKAMISCGSPTNGMDSPSKRLRI